MAPIYTDANTACDQNQLVMEVAEDADGLAAGLLNGAEEGHFLVQGLAGVRAEDGGDAEGAALDISTANEIAEAMKQWAVERGATHFTHWFQPMTGVTAEKHDSFISPTGGGRIISTR